MSNTSNDLLLSLAECDSFYCNCSKQNDDSEIEETSKCDTTSLTKNKSEHFKSKSQSLGEDRSEHYARLLKESERALSNRNILISLLQEQLVKMEELYKKTLEKQRDSRFQYNLNPWFNKVTEDKAVIERKNADAEEGDKATEHKSLVKIFENSFSRNSSSSSLHFRNADNVLAQQSKRLDTIFEKGNSFIDKHDFHELKTSTSLADSSELSLVDSMRSLNVIHMKSVRSKIETEFFQECQVNFEGPIKSNHVNKEISELLRAQEEIDCLRHKFRRLALETSQPHRNGRDEMESFFEQAGKDKSALEKALRSQNDMIEDLQKNIKEIANERLELNRNLLKRHGSHLNELNVSLNEVRKGSDEMLHQKLSCDFGSFAEQSLYENPRHSRTMVESELRLLNEQLFQKEYVINAQQKKMRRLEDKLENTYQELVKHVVKNKKLCCDCESKIGDYANAQKEILRLEEALKSSELKIEEERKFQRRETQQNEEIIGDLQNKLIFMAEEMERTKDENLSCAHVFTLDELNANYKCKEQSKDFHMKEFEKFKNCESEQSLTPEEVQSQISVAVKRKQQDIDVLQIKIIQMASELENANKEITKCVDQNRTLLEDYEIKLEQVENQYQWAKNENNLLKSKIQEEKESFAKANENFESVIRQKDERLKQLEQELVDQVKTELLTQKDNLVDELRESLNEAVNNAKNLKEIFESKLREKDKRIGVLDQNFRQMAEELDNTNKERTDFVQEVQRLFSEYDVKLAVVNGECENAQKKILQLKQNENALHLLLTTAQAEAEKLKRAYEALSLHKQTMEEELRSEIVRSEKELFKENRGEPPQGEHGNGERCLEEQIKSLRDIVSQQKEQLETSNKGRLNLMNKIKKLQGELETKTTTLKQREYNFQIKIALLLKELEDTDQEREAYLTKNKQLFRRYENEIRQLNVDYKNTRNEIRCLKRGKSFRGGDLSQDVINLKNEVTELNEELKLRGVRLIRQKKDRENLQKQIKKMSYDYEDQLTSLNAQCEQYEKKILLVSEENENLIRRSKENETKSKNSAQIETLLEEVRLQAEVLQQKEEEINNLQSKISEMEIELETVEKEKVDWIKQNEKKIGRHRGSESSLFERASDRSISIIKEESMLEAYEELITEKEILQGKLKETEQVLESERRSKTEAESELIRFRENEKALNENLMKILPEFLGQGDKTLSDAKTFEAIQQMRLLETFDEHRPIDLQNRLSLLSKELENAKAEKRELIRKGKQIFYHYEANIIKLRNDYERLQNEMIRIRSEQSVDENYNMEPRSLEIINHNTGVQREYEQRLSKINTHYKSTKEEAQQLKESQEAYSKKLTCCLKELAIYKDDVKNWMEAYDKIVKEKSDLETEIKILVNNVLHKDEMMKEIQNKLCDVQDKYESVAKEDAKKAQIISDCESKYHELNVEYEDAQNKLWELKRCKDEMNQKIIAKDKVIRQYEEQVDSERNENARLNEYIGILKGKLNTLEEDIDTKEKQFNLQLEKNKSAIFDLSENYEKLKIEYDYLMKQQEAIKFYKIENINLIREVEERDEKIKGLKSEIEELKKELCSVRAEMDLHNADASLNWEELHRTCAELEKKLELTKYALKKQECQTMIKADDDFKDLQRQIDTLRDSNGFLKEKLDCKDEEIVRLSEKLERALKEKTELNLHMVNTIRELEGEIDEIKSNNRLLRGQITDRSHQLLQQKQQEVHKDNECEILRQQLREANTQKTNLEADTKKLREMLHGVEEKCTGLKARNEGLQADISVMERELLVSKSWKTENADLQGKLDNIESELFIVKHQCAEVNEQLKTTKIKLAETQEELSSTKRDLASARSSMSGYGVEIKNESQFMVGKERDNKQTSAVQDVAGSICADTDLEKGNFHSQEENKIKLNKHITVLYNNMRYTESKCETTESTVSSVLLAKGSKIQERLASLNQMEKEVEDMISAVQQQNKKLKDCHSARVKNEKDIDSRLQKVRRRRDNLETEFNTFQTEIGHRITHPVSVRRRSENS